MEIHRYSVGELQANAYLVIQDSECILIDPGDEAPFLLEEILRRNLELVGMIATHGHFDHVMAVGEIQLSYNVPLYIHKDDQFLLDRLEETATHFLGYVPIVIPIKNTKLLINKFENYLKIGPPAGGWKLKIIQTPGHSPGSISIVMEDCIFTGDTLFADGVGSTDHSYSSKKDLAKSLEKIQGVVKPGWTIYPGHGEEFIVE